MVKRQSFSHFRQQRGLALIVVITTMAVLIGLAANYVLTVSRDSDAVMMLNSRIQARYSALSGIQYGLFAMQDKDKQLRWATDGRLYSAELAGGEVYVRILPESGKLDINRASPQLLTLLLTYAGVDEAEAGTIANNIKHWTGRSEAGFEDSVSDDDYESAGLPVPRHRTFYAIEELSQVIGITPARYQKIKSLITVYGSNRINGLVASDEILAMLQLTDADIANIHAAREAYYNEEVPISAEVRQLNEFLTFNSRAAYYRVEAMGTTAAGQSESIYSIVKNRRSRQGSYQEMERGPLNNRERQQLQTLIGAYQQTLEQEKK